MKRLLITAALMLAALPASAQTGLLIVDRSQADNAKIFKGGNFTRTAITLAEGESVLGLGAGRTNLTVNASVTGSFISSSPITRASVSHVTIDGGQPVAEFPWGSEQELALAEVADMVVLSAQVQEVSHNVLTNFRGAGIRLSGGAAGDLGVMFRADFNHMWEGWTGIEMASSDMSAMGNVIGSMRDYGIHCTGGGPHRLTDNHCYGMKWALYVSGGASNITSTNDMFADSTMGIRHLGGGRSRYINCHLYHNADAAAYLDSVFGVEFIAPTVTVGDANVTWGDRRGIHFLAATSDHQIIGGDTTLDGHDGTLPATAIRVESDTSTIKDHWVYDVDGLDGSRGLHIPTVINGGAFEYHIYGFEGTGDKALDIDDAGLTGVTITIIGDSRRSAGFNATDAAQYVDVPVGWGVDGAMTGGPTLVFAATGDTITRGAGSWVTDGFNVGETVTITNADEAGNNVTGAPITAVSALVLTLGTTALTEDASDAGSTIVSKNGTTITIVDAASKESLTLTPGTAY